MTQLIGFLWLFVSNSAFSAQNMPLTSVMLSEQKIIKQFSIEDLETAIQGMSSSLEGKAWCGTTEDNAKLMILPLRPIYEKKFNQERKRGSIKDFLQKAKACEAHCRCELYASLLSGRKGISKTEVSALFSRAKALTPSAKENCLKEQSQLCKTPLLPSLRAIAIQEYSAPSNY